MITVEERNNRRFNEIVRDYTAKGRFTKLIQLVGMSNSDRDYQESDAGEPPAGARWN
jgi:hypothetical protein